MKFRSNYFYLPKETLGKQENVFLLLASFASLQIMLIIKESRKF